MQRRGMNNFRMAVRKFLKRCKSSLGGGGQIHSDRIQKGSRDGSSRGLSSLESSSLKKIRRL